MGSVTTERMHLRPFADGDLDGLAEVFAKPEVWRFPYGRGFSREETRDFLRSQIEHWDRFGFGCWIAELAADGDPIIGYVGLSVPHFLPDILPAVEVGWRFDPDHWGHGFATEGARAALEEGFTRMGLEEICSLPQSTNPPSSRVCERLGMRFDRSITCPATDRRGAVEARMYVMTADEWVVLPLQLGHPVDVVPRPYQHAATLVRSMGRSQELGATDVGVDVDRREQAAEADEVVEVVDVVGVPVVLSDGAQEGVLDADLLVLLAGPAQLLVDVAGRHQGAVRVVHLVPAQRDGVGFLQLSHG